LPLVVFVRSNTVLRDDQEFDAAGIALGGGSVDPHDRPTLRIVDAHHCLTIDSAADRRLSAQLSGRE
jgi:hypothetical protein